MEWFKRNLITLNNFNMSVRTYILAFIPNTDETYQKQKKVLLACAEAGVELPEVTARYFGQSDPDEYLLDHKLEIQLEENVHFEIYNDDMISGIEIELKNLPKGVAKLRFINSW